MTQLNLVLYNTIKWPYQPKHSPSIDLNVSSSFQITPVFGIFCVLMILLVLREPPRGAAEGGSHLANTSWFTDVKSLLKK